jgi:hypothetical protein
MTVCRDQPPWVKRGSGHTVMIAILLEMTRDLHFLQDDGESYMAYAVFQAQAMSDWAVRTEDPWQANFFLMYVAESNTRTFCSHGCCTGMI